MTSSSRIPIEAANGVTGALFGIAILTYACRLYIQLWVFRRFPIEDYFILFSVIVLIASTALWFASMNSLFRAVAIVLNRQGSSALLLEGLQSIPTDSRRASAISTLWWFVIFPVKLGYLLFFKKLVSRLKHLTRYWWFVVAFLLPAMIVTEVVTWQACPYHTIAEVAVKCQGQESGDRALRVSVITSTLDILSDIFIASIPLVLLWRVRISARQKLGLGLSLCLSLVMAVVALVRTAGMRLPTGDADVVWLTFWTEAEANICVTMISLTSFRSFFIRDSDVSKDSHPKLWSKLSLSSLRSSLRRRFCCFFRAFRSPRESNDASFAKSGDTLIQSGGGSGIGSNALQNDRGSRQSGPDDKLPRTDIRPMEEVKIPKGKFSSLWSAMDRVGRTRNESYGGSVV